MPGRRGRQRPLCARRDRGWCCRPRRDLDAEDPAERDAANSPSSLGDQTGYANVRQAWAVTARVTTTSHPSTSMSVTHHPPFRQSIPPQQSCRPARLPAPLTFCVKVFFRHCRPPRRNRVPGIQRRQWGGINWGGPPPVGQAISKVCTTRPPAASRLPVRHRGCHRRLYRGRRCRPDGNPESYGNATAGDTPQRVPWIMSA